MYVYRRGQQMAPFIYHLRWNQLGAPKTSLLREANIKDHIDPSDIIYVYKRWDEVDPREYWRIMDWLSPGTRAIIIREQGIKISSMETLQPTDTSHAPDDAQPDDADYF